VKVLRLFNEVEDLRRAVGLLVVGLPTLITPPKTNIFPGKMMVGKYDPFLKKKWSLFLGKMLDEPRGVPLMTNPRFF